MRKLATIQSIKSIRPIEGADSIELATVLGWNVVVKKGEFSEGDLAVYFEIDSFLPCRPEFEFLRKGCYKQLPDGTEGFRLRTVRLRGKLSQGLLIPLSNAFPDGAPASLSPGDEVTDLLGVKKYEPPIPASLSGVAKGLFPQFIQKTDQERIQNVFDDYKNLHGEKLFEITIKLDGSSATYYMKDGVFGVCSRNLELCETDGNTFWNIARRYDIEGVLRKMCLGTARNIAIQGEIIGEGIQGNKEKIKGHDFYLFDIFDIDSQSYYDPHDRRILYLYYMEGAGIKHVPILSSWPIFAKTSLDEILEMATGKSLNPDVMREGLVFKSYRNQEGSEGIVSFKAISNKFLEKHGE